MSDSPPPLPQVSSFPPPMPRKAVDDEDAPPPLPVTIRHAMPSLTAAGIRNALPYIGGRFQEKHFSGNSMLRLIWHLVTSPCEAWYWFTSGISKITRFKKNQMIALWMLALVLLYFNTPADPTPFWEWNPKDPVTLFEIANKEPFVLDLGPFGKHAMPLAGTITAPFRMHKPVLHNYYFQTVLWMGLAVLLIERWFPHFFMDVMAVPRPIWRLKRRESNAAY